MRQRWLGLVVGMSLLLGACGGDKGETAEPLDTSVVVVDDCPDDPAKLEAGSCGCGVADTDSDGDGRADCEDACPQDADKTAPGVCGCGVSEADSDGDGARDCEEACPDDPAKLAPGACGCGVSDGDSDGDGPTDCEESCPFDPEKLEPGVCGCGQPDVDTDGDGLLDCLDGCPLVADPDQADSDGDGVGDACEACQDVDGDGYGDGTGGNADCVALSDDCALGDASLWAVQDYYADGDADGVSVAAATALCGGASVPAGYLASAGTDCDDSDAGAYREMSLYEDNDLDGVSSSVTQALCIGASIPAGYQVALAGPADCDDEDASVWELRTYYPDVDGDTYGGAAGQQVCVGLTAPVGFVLTGTDCNDGDGRHWADCGLCVDGDDDGRGGLCDLGADCDDAQPYAWASCATCADSDGDGYLAGCDAYPGCDALSCTDLANDSEDCDDADYLVNPYHPDWPLDGVDQDCSGADRGLNEPNVVYLNAYAPSGGDGSKASPFNVLVFASQRAEELGAVIYAAEGPIGAETGDPNTFIFCGFNQGFTARDPATYQTVLADIDNLFGVDLTGPMRPGLDGCHLRNSELRLTNGDGTGPHSPHRAWVNNLEFTGGEKLLFGVNNVLDQINVTRGTNLRLTGSRFTLVGANTHNITPNALINTVRGETDVELINNVFAMSNGVDITAITVGPTTRMVISGNLFSGFERVAFYNFSNGASGTTGPTTVIAQHNVVRGNGAEDATMAYISSNASNGRTSYSYFANNYVENLDVAIAIAKTEETSLSNFVIKDDVPCAIGDLYYACVSSPATAWNTPTANVYVQGGLTTANAMFSDGQYRLGAGSPLRGAGVDPVGVGGSPEALLLRDPDGGYFGGSGTYNVGRFAN